MNTQQSFCIIAHQDTARDGSYCLFGEEMELIHDITIAALLCGTVKRHPDRLALASDKSCFTYRQLLEKADEIACDLSSMGIKRGDFVGLYGTNCVSGILMYYALMRIGATAVFLGDKLTSDELGYRLNRVPVKLVCFWSALPEGYDCTVYTVDVSDIDLLPSHDILHGGNAGYTLCGAAPDDIDAILFTSGTTGGSKPVATTHFSRGNNALAQGEALGISCDDRYCLVLPMHHCFSLSACILAAMARGACICIPADRRTKSVMAEIQKRRCTVLLLVPTYFSSLLNSSEFGNFDLSSLRTGMMGGSKYPPELFLQVQSAFGMKLIPSLGQTEATAGFTMGKPDEPNNIAAETVGYFMEHIEGRLLDIASGSEVLPGKVGEICIRGYNVMQGYYNMPDETAEAVHNGWLHTGDLAYQDEQGRIFLTGRKKELIIKGGENISPWEIEKIIAEDARVAQVKVIGVPDRHYIEEVCAVISPKPGCCLAADCIRSLVGKHLSKSKIPAHVIFISSFPLNPNGKINTGKLKEIAMEHLKQEAIR